MFVPCILQIRFKQNAIEEVREVSRSVGYDKNARLKITSCIQEWLWDATHTKQAVQKTREKKMGKNGIRRKTESERRKKKEREKNATRSELNFIVIEGFRD